MYMADPVCSKSPEHGVIQQAIDFAKVTASLASDEKPLVFRNSRNSKAMSIS
jgi:PqqA peptide cyclase